LNDHLRCFIQGSGSTKTNDPLSTQIL